MLSGPPETATAISGRASNPPIAASLALNSGNVSGVVSTAQYSRRACSGSAAEVFHLDDSVLPDRGGRLGKLFSEFRQRNTGILLLVGAGQRHAEFQQRI